MMECMRLACVSRSDTRVRALHKRHRSSQVLYCFAAQSAAATLRAFVPGFDEDRASGKNCRRGSTEILAPNFNRALEGGCSFFVHISGGTQQAQLAVVFLFTSCSIDVHIAQRALALES